MSRSVQRQPHSPTGTDLVGVFLSTQEGTLLALAHHFDEPIASDATLYLARVYAGTIAGGRWGAWIVFFPIGGGPVISTDRETTQSSMAALSTWAVHVTHTYLEGALQRALELQPDAELTEELERLERLQLQERSAQPHEHTGG